jgi:signal transduction histidine kinase
VCVLADRLDDTEDAARALVASGLSGEQLAAVDAMRAACLEKKNRVARSPLEQVDREEAIHDWLARHRLDSSLAAMLAETEVTLENLNSLAGRISGPTLNAALNWAASGCSIRSLTGEIQGSSARISSLVMAIKGFTHMDQAIVAERIDPGSGLRDAVSVMNAKASERSVEVSVDIEPDLPEVFCFAAELNQIWGILIDNALDATAQGGCVEVSACQEGQRIVVRVVDHGAGVPEKIRSMIFDPFFTTKPLGYGTGLGLDIARRLVRHNDGMIDFDSQPGRTEFWVSLPVAEANHF